jgi:uncharacterized protein
VRLSRHIAVVAAVGAVLLATAAGGKPSPFPSFSAPLVDTVHVVPAEVAQQIDAQLQDYQSRTGNQIAVAIVHTTGNEALEDYSIKLARQWGVGSKDKDNGVLLFIAYDDHKLRIEVGRGLEGNLTDLVSGRIIRDIIVPQMRANDPGQAVLTGTQAIRAALGDTQVGPLPVAPPQPAPTSQSTPGWLVFVIIAGLILFVILGQFGRRRRWPGFGGGFAGPIFWGGGFGGGGGGGGGFGGGGFGGGGGGGFGGGGASGGW